MFNLWFGVLFMLAHFTLFLISYRLFGKVGIFAWIGMATVVANIQVVKTVDLQFGTLAIVITLGNTMYGTIYLASDLLNEKYGEADAKKAVWFGFFTLIASTIIMQMALLFNPAEPGVAGASSASDHIRHAAANCPWQPMRLFCQPIS